MKKRNYRMDNLKGVLIFLVVFCHFLELFGGDSVPFLGRWRIYMIVYMFHMPFFVFVSGYFARFSLSNILKKQLFPYVIFQILYCYVFGRSLTFITPYWHLWYMLSMVYWTLSLIVVRKNKWIALVLSAVFALGAGFFEKIGYTMTASRAICFYPFFLLGSIAADHREGWRKILPPKFNLWGLLILAGAFAATYFVVPHMKTETLYQSYSYNMTGNTCLSRIVIMVIAGLWILGAMLVMPNKKVPVLSMVGECTIAVFLLHGFVVKWMSVHQNPFVFGEGLNILTALLFALILVLLLGNRFVTKLMRPVTDFGFWIQLWNNGKEILFKIKKENYKN